MEEKPAAAADEVSLEGGANERIVGKDDVTTAVQGSAKGAVRGIEAQTEEREVKNKHGRVEKEEVAKAASGDKLAGDAERKAKLIAEMNAKLRQGAPERPPTKTKVAQEINLNPSEAQKLAGNYKKGHRRVEGLDYTIENPRGALRRGVDEHGEPWQVKMPADYGYIRGTEGADGDHVDAYDLRSGNRHFVVDQLDHRSGEFDEHKVMLRAKDEQHAVDTYHSAFADGRGPDRLGNLHEVTAPELKDWLKTADTTKPITEHVAGEPDVFTPPTEKGVKDLIHTPDGGSFHSLRSDYLANELERFDFKHMQGVGGVLARFIQSRLQKISNESDTVVHHVREADMAKLFEKSDEKGTPYGLHWIDENTGVSHVAISDAVKSDGIEHGSLAHVLLHEAVHSVTVREINSNPAVRMAIRRLMKMSADWMEHPDNAPHVELLYGDETRYAFTNEKEFIAEAFSNSRFQEVLSVIPMHDPVMADYLGLNKNNMSMWDVFRGYVKKALEKIMGPMPKQDTVLDGIMKVGEHIENIHKRDYVEARKQGAAVSAPKLVHAEAFHMVDQAKRAVQDYIARPENNTAERSPKMLKLPHVRQHRADRRPLFWGEQSCPKNRTRPLNGCGSPDKKSSSASEPLVNKLVTLRAANGEVFREFQSLLHDATVANVHPDVPLSDAKNAHLGKNKVVGTAAGRRKQHPELAKRFNALPEAYKAAWHDVS